MKIWYKYYLSGIALMMCCLVSAWCLATARLMENISETLKSASVKVIVQPVEIRTERVIEKQVPQTTPYYPPQIQTLPFIIPTNWNWATNGIRYVTTPCITTTNEWKYSDWTNVMLLSTPHYETREVK